MDQALFSHIGFQAGVHGFSSVAAFYRLKCRGPLLTGIQSHFPASTLMDQARLNQSA